MNEIKQDITMFMVECPNFQQVKAGHWRPSSIAQHIETSTGKWEDVNMNFVVGLPCIRKQYESIWIIMDRMTK